MIIFLSSIFNVISYNPTIILSHIRVRVYIYPCEGFAKTSELSYILEQINTLYIILPKMISSIILMT